MKSRRKTDAVPSSIDLGPSTDGGGFVGAASIVLETRPDPTRTDRIHLVRGARRRTAIGDLYSRGSITKSMHDAVDRFLDDCSVASGGVGGSDYTGMPSAPSSRVGLPERQVRAIGAVRRVFHLLGLHSCCVFWAVVFDNSTLREWEARSRVRNGSGVPLLRAALTALDDHYNPVVRAA